MEKTMEHDMHSEHHMNHSSSSSMMMMSMFFHGGFSETVLFQFWTTDSPLGLILAMVIVCAMAVAYEALKFAREIQLRKTFESQGVRRVSDGDGDAAEQTSTTLKPEPSLRVMSVRTHMLSSGHLQLTLLHVLQTALAYILMLVVMTYNTWLFLAVVIGAGIGYFLFGWKRTILVDDDNACH